MGQSMATSTTTVTVQNDVYAFITPQKGAMAGLGIQGNKITKLAK
jgi:lipid-binding SYLF domain-containing protein